MAYQVLARKWRPQAFDDVLGQQHVTDVLKNMLATGRLHHGYLFSGIRGIGKTTTARILAKAFNCVNGPTPEPCNQCEFCREITDGYSIDVEEIDGASNRGVDDVRILQDNASYAPSRSRYKIFLIDEVHMLTTEAFNALLKTMEEPPANVVFILATTEPWKIPLTILSRCQQFKFQAGTSDDVFGLLKKIAGHEGITISDDSLNVIVKTAGGSVRDAENLFDQVIGFSGHEIQDLDVRQVLGIPDSQLLHDTFMALIQHQTSQTFSIMEHLVNQGYNLRLFCMEIMERIRNMLVLKIARHPDPYLVLFDYGRADLERYAIHTTLVELQHWYWLISEAERNIKFSPQPRFLLEMALARMTYVPALEPLEELDAQLTTLQTEMDAVEPGTTMFARSKQQSQQPKGLSAISSMPSLRSSQLQQSEPVAQPLPPRIPSLVMPKPAPVLQHSYAPPSQELRQSWEAILAVIRQKSPGLKATLKHAEPLELTEKILTLGFHSDSKFAHARIKDPKNAKVIQEAVLEYLGHSVQVQTTLYDGALSTETIQEKLAQQPASQPRPEAPSQPYVPPGAARTQSSSESGGSGQKREWKGERKGGGSGEWKGRGNKQTSQYKAPVQVSVNDVVRMFEGEIED